MKIVQFENGKYGVRVYWLFGWYFLSKHGVYNWKDVEGVADYCQLETFEEAKKLLQMRQNKYKTIKTKQQEDAEAIEKALAEYEAYWAGYMAGALSSYMAVDNLKKKVEKKPSEKPELKIV